MNSAGDILFYDAIPGDVYDDAIVRVTNSPYVHVAIAINGVQKIEALSGGVMINYLSNARPFKTWSYMTEVPDFDPVALHNALNWLLMQKGNAYSWGDAADILLQKFHFPVSFATNNLLFCSGLAVEFLLQAGKVPGLQGRMVDPHNETPMLLAKDIGLK